jgi:hypothetical protein
MASRASLGISWACAREGWGEEGIRRRRALSGRPGGVYQSCSGSVRVRALGCRRRSRGVRSLGFARFRRRSRPRAAGERTWGERDEPRRTMGLFDFLKRKPSGSESGAASAQLAELLRKLDDPDPKVRLAACRDLGALGRRRSSGRREAARAPRRRGRRRLQRGSGGPLRDRALADLCALPSASAAETRRAPCEGNAEGEFREPRRQPFRLEGYFGTWRQTWMKLERREPQVST